MSCRGFAGGLQAPDWPDLRKGQPPALQRCFTSRLKELEPHLTTIASLQSVALPVSSCLACYPRGVGSDGTLTLITLPGPALRRPLFTFDPGWPLDLLPLAWLLTSSRLSVPRRRLCLALLFSSLLSSFLCHLHFVCPLLCSFIPTRSLPLPTRTSGHFPVLDCNPFQNEPGNEKKKTPRPCSSKLPSSEAFSWPRNASQETSTKAPS